MHVKIINAQAELASAEEVLKAYAEKHGMKKQDKDSHLRALFRIANKHIGEAIAMESETAAAIANETAIILHFYVNRNY